MPIKGIGNYEPGSNRHMVRLNDGTLVSRSTAENMYAESKGFRNNFERKSIFREVRSTQAGKNTNDRDWERARANGISRQDFNDQAALVRKNYRDVNYDHRRIDKSPDGPLARYLVTIGRRSDTADYAVGDSPKVV